jgi:hypothetical protein
MSRYQKSTSNQEQLKIIKNEITNIDQKTLFNQIKAASKQTPAADALQERLCK